MTETSNGKGDRVKEGEGESVVAIEDFFVSQYASVEQGFLRLAGFDGAVYVPNPEPAGPVDFIFIAMEPSLGRWGRDREGAEGWVGRGFRNFLLSIYDFIMHYSIREFLCRSGETYQVTDISKGAMLVRDAKKDRERRWRKWYPSLLKEIKLLEKPGTKIIAVGGDVERFLRRMGFAKIDERICHFSIEARGCWKRIVLSKEDEYNAFCRLIDFHDILRVAEQAMIKAKMSQDMRKTILQSLPFELSDAHKWLLFSCKIQFETFANRD